jgi:hypothetical membrane protein
VANVAASYGSGRVTNEAISRSPAGSTAPKLLAHSAWTKWTGLVTVIGSIGFLVLFTVLGFLRPGYSPVSQAISDLGVGQLAWALNTPLVITGALLIGFALALTQDAMFPVANPGWRWLLGALLEAQGLGLIIAGVFPETEPTHWLVGAPAFFIGSVIGFMAAGALLWRVPGWRGFSIYALIAGVIGLVLVVFQNLAFAAQYGLMPGSPLADVPVGGLAERLVFLNILAWYSVAGWRLFRASAGDRG